MTCFFHNPDDIIIRDTVTAVGEEGIVGAGQGLGRGKCVALDTGNLDQPGNRITGQAEVVLKGHLGCILHLAGSASHQLGRGPSRHGTGYTHLSLASHLRTGNGRIELGEISDQPGCCQRV